MKFKFLALILVSFVLSACEVPPQQESRVITDGQYLDTGEGFGSQFAGIADGELAPGVYDTVYFATDSSALTSEARSILNAQADWLKRNSALDIIVEGHCDERATREYNLALGERRANAVKKYLVSSGVSSSKISTISYGAERPSLPGSNPESWSRNRRGVTIVR